MHDVPPVHATPHPPQFVWLCVTSTQLPEQSMAPVGQTLVQTPALQTCPLLQVTPQAPQFLTSAEVERQTPPQSWVPEAHPHALAEQIMPVVHRRLQVPQLSGSLVVSTQAAPQAVAPCGHVVTHCPWEQTWLPLQALPQLPQLVASLRRSRH